MLQRRGGRPSERRTGRRFARRAQVRYWVRGEDEPRHAFVHDLSATGVFVVTPYPVPRGTEISIEIHDADTRYTVEAVVARRVWMAPDLRRLGPTGMGARFLLPEEVVERLRERGAGRAVGASQREGHYRIVIEDDREMLQRYARDLEAGGLFIPTERPPQLNREILIDLELPGGREALKLAARVVHRIPPDQGGTLRAGVAVVFEDGPGVWERLRPYLTQPVAEGEPEPAE